MRGWSARGRCSIVSNDTTTSTLASGRDSDAALPSAKLKIGQCRVTGSRVGDCSGIDVDPRHAAGDCCQQRAAVPFPAGHIEDALRLDMAPRECVAMPVLVRDLAGNSRDKALAGEFEVGGHRLEGAINQVRTLHQHASPARNFSRTGGAAWFRCRIAAPLSGTKAARYHCVPSASGSSELRHPRRWNDPKPRPVNNLLRTHALSLPKQPFAVFASFWKHRTLVLSLARRDVLGRYSGSFLGLMWSFFNPLLMLGVYTYVFGVVFKARWSPDASTGILEFAVVLFAGLLTFGIFSEIRQSRAVADDAEPRLREARGLSAGDHAVGGDVLEPLPHADQPRSCWRWSCCWAWAHCRRRGR